MLHELLGRIEENRRADASTSKEAMTEPGDVQAVLAKFDPLWEQLTTWEQERFIWALVTEVRYDGRTQTVTVGFRSEAIKDLCRGIVPEGKNNK